MGKLNSGGVFGEFVSVLQRRYELASRAIFGDTIRRKLSDGDRDFLEWVFDYVGLPELKARVFSEVSSGANSQGKGLRRTKRISRVGR